MGKVHQMITIDSEVQAAARADPTFNLSGECNRYLRHRLFTDNSETSLEDQEREIRQQQEIMKRQLADVAANLRVIEAKKAALHAEKEKDDFEEVVRLVRADRDHGGWY